MPETNSSLRSAVRAFVAERLAAKLDKLKPDETDKRAELIGAYQPEPWLDDAARRAGQLQLATHTLKPLHPDARGTQIYQREAPPDDASIGTHTLRRDEVAADVVGNAAALDVFKLLKVSDASGESLLAKLLRGDPDAAAALGDGDVGQARAAALKQIAAAPASPASHTHGKQLFFPLPDGGYHLLAPLFPTSLVHHVHQHLQQARFGDETVAARKARSDEKGHPQGYRDFPRLLVRAFGGTKPQNISQLNSERGGKSQLFSMLPPVWRSQGTKPILGQKDVFAPHGAFVSRKPVREALRLLRDFFNKVADIETNVRIRQDAEALTEDLIEQLVLFTAEYRQLPAGWSNDADCVLRDSQRLWLDQGTELRDGAEAVDWPAEVAKAFAAWLKSGLSSDDAAMQQEEYAEWARLSERRLLAELKEWADED
jgi:CRISPR-associated protein Csy1